jgi:excisionase family DNA binding protein
LSHALANEDEDKEGGGTTVEQAAIARYEAPSDILTSREARELLKIGRTKLWDLTRRNVIPAYRLGQGKTSGLRYKRSELLAWLDEHRI